MVEIPCYTPEPEKDRVVYYNPSDYWRGFKESEYYRRALDRRMKIMASNGIVGDLRTEAEELLDQDHPELATEELRDFYRSGHEIKFISGWEGWTPNFKLLLKRYWQAIENMASYKKHGGGDREEFDRLDEKRSGAHQKAAEQLVEDKLSPNDEFGRELVHLMTTSENLAGVDDGSSEARLEMARNRWRDH